MKYLLNLKKMPYFHLWVLAFFYLPQSIIGFYKYELPYAFLFISIALTSIFSYLFFLKFIFSNQKFTSMIKNINKLAFDVGSHSYFIFTLYFALILYAILTSEQIPLFMVFKGASIDELAQNREMFLRTREGWESVIPYINAFFIMALIPYSLTSLFYTKHKLRFHFLGLFLFCLALTLEKSVAVLAIVPIIRLMVNTQKNNKFFRLIIFLIMFIAAVSFLSRGGASSQNEELVGGANAIPENYQLFTGQSQLHYIANRIFGFHTQQRLIGLNFRIRCLVENMFWDLR